MGDNGKEKTLPAPRCPTLGVKNAPKRGGTYRRKIWTGVEPGWLRCFKKDVRKVRGNSAGKKKKLTDQVFGA